MQLKPLNETIGKLVDEFLNDADYYEQFEAVARRAGVTSEDPNAIKVAMFSAEKGELIFAAKELEELFMEYQLFTKLRDQEPYSSLLTQYPERKTQVSNIAKRTLEGDEVTDEEIIKLFEGLADHER